MKNIHNLRMAISFTRTMNQGIALAFLTACISGVSVFVNRYAVAEFDSPTVFTTLKNTLVGFALIAIALRAGVVREIRGLPPRTRSGLIVLGIVGGSVPFVLFFEGLALVEAGNAAFIHKTLFLWVAVLAVVLGGERLGWPQLSALGMLLLAQLLLGGPGSLSLSIATTMVLLATLLWSIEVILAKHLLVSTGSTLGAVGRMGIGAVLMLVYTSVTGRAGELTGLTIVQWAWALATGVLLLAYVITWYAALKRAPATVVTCVLTIGAPITAALSAVAGGGIPNAEQLAGYAVLAVSIGLLVMVGNSRRAPIVREGT